MGKNSQHLTRRENEVALLLALGQSRKEIANTLDISPNTARYYAKQIFDKFGLESQLAIAMNYEFELPGPNPFISTSEKITPAEQKIMECLLLGKNNAETAQILRISEETVKSHITHVSNKTGIRRRTLLALYWRQAMKEAASAEANSTSTLPLRTEIPSDLAFTTLEL